MTTTSDLTELVDVTLPLGAWAETLTTVQLVQEGQPQTQPQPKSFADTILMAAHVITITCREGGSVAASPDLNRPYKVTLPRGVWIELTTAATLVKNAIAAKQVDAQELPQGFAARMGTVAHAIGVAVVGTEASAEA